MKRGHDLAKLMKFASRPEWVPHLDNAVDAHVGLALVQFESEFTIEDLPDLIGDFWVSTLWAYSLEALATQVVEPDGRNLIDDYLKRRGWRETSAHRLYMRALQTSVMSLYEVSAIEPGVGFLARDLIRGGEPIQVHERNAAKMLTQWDHIAARIFRVGERNILADSLLPFSAQATACVLNVLRSQAEPYAPLAIVDGRQQTLAALLSMTWLLDTLPQVLEPDTRYNVEKDEVVFHHVSFPFMQDPTIIGKRLDTIPALRRETSHLWNWLEPKSNKKNTRPMTWEVLMDDGALVLGTLELKDRSILLSVASVKRAQRGIELVTQALGNLVGTPLTEIKTPEQIMGQHDLLGQHPMLFPQKLPLR